MSSILNAFKKLENDKRINKQEQLRIDENILQDGLSTRLSSTALSLIAVALFVCGSGATYLYLKRDSTKMAEPQIIYSDIKSKRQPPVSKTMIQPVLNVDKSHDISLRPLLPRKASALSETHPRSPNTEKISSQTSQTSQHDKQEEIIPAIVSRSVTKSSPSTIASIRPTLTVNGIAFQEGGRDNMAMINGISVSKGDMIEGVRVEDIQKNRVIFSQGGEKFDINLNKSNR